MGNLIYAWPILIIPFVVLVCGTCQHLRGRGQTPRPELWSPAKLALAEHETGVHPLRRACAEDGCQQCRMFVDAPTSFPIGDGRTFRPNHDPATMMSMIGMETENERRRREYPELHHDAPLPGPRILPVAMRSSP